MPNDILVFAEHREGKLNRLTWEAIVAGQKFAAQLKKRLSVVLLGKHVGDLALQVAQKKVDEVLVGEDDQLEHYTPDAYTAAMKQVLQAEEPHLLLLGHTYLVRDFAPKLAAALGKGFVSDCIGYRIENGELIFVRQFFQGKFSADLTFRHAPPYLVSFQAGAFNADNLLAAEKPAAVRSLPLSLSGVPVRTKVLEIFEGVKQAVDLSKADFIVAVGRGIKGKENLSLVEKLAAALGAELAASRPVCDEGWLPLDRQVGSSGQTVAPKLYLAVGVSGAIQHVVGMKNSRTIVAINKDPEAPIFDIADYGVVGDLFEIVPALTEKLEEVRGG